MYGLVRGMIQGSERILSMMDEECAQIFILCWVFDSPGLTLLQKRDVIKIDSDHNNI